VKRAARWWIVFGTCNVIVAAALIWITAVVVELERAELRARTETDYQESLRSAMWRMDSWLSVFLAREAARPHLEYQPYFVQQSVYDRRSAGRGPAGSLTPSPLLGLKSDYLLLHFEIDPGSGVTSPQIPIGPFEQSPDPSVVSDAELARRIEALQRLRPYLDAERIRSRVDRADSMATTKLAGAAQQASAPDAIAANPVQTLKSQNEYDARVNCAVPPPPGGNKIGRLIPLWLDHPDARSEPALVFVRRVHTGGRELFQGFGADWIRLRERLLFEIRDLFPQAALRRVSVDAPVDPLGRYLANIPAALAAPVPGPVAGTRITPARAALGLAWVAVIAATIAVGATLRTSIELGERRRRFVSAVTHELRTPLTTFQLYSEMLANGVVQEEQKRRQYLGTLKEESERLSAMVENVLAHARLEERRSARRLEPMTLDALLARVAPPLERRAEAAGMSLEIETETGGSVTLEVDAAAIGQVLGNLVDNAGKYARNGRQPRVHLLVSMRDGALTLRVRDHGPGIPRERVKTIFAPFDRGGRDPSDPIPGVGLGLALARGLAREMGGDLTLETPRDEGACFRLDVPAKATRSA
jgi:signal transduction histidine kinase